jgi:hypothetical protein
MRLNPSLKAHEPKRPPTPRPERPMGERRLAILKLLIVRTRLFVGVVKAEECRPRTLLEDNPASG